MADKYVVYVAAPEEPPSSDARLHLAELLGLDLPKLDALLRRLPGEVTKPVPETTAITVARRFREAGLEASIQRQPGDSPPVEREEQPASREAAPRTPLAAPRTPVSEPRDDDDDWGREFGPTDSRRRDKEDSDEEDGLFPPSAFTPPKGAKAPSRPLVIALLVVLAIFVALWLLL